MSKTNSCAHTKNNHPADNECEAEEGEEKRERMVWGFKSIENLTLKYVSNLCYRFEKPKNGKCPRCGGFLKENTFDTYDPFITVIYYQCKCGYEYAKPHRYCPVFPRFIDSDIFRR